MSLRFVSRQFDDGSLYLQLAEETDGEKLAFVEATDRASLVFYDTDAPEEFWSNLAKGTSANLPARIGFPRLGYD